MAWIVKNISDSIIDIRELCINFQGKAVKDLDIIGRDNAERSSELKQMFQKGFLITIAKDPAPKIDGQLIQKLEAAAGKIEKATSQGEQHAAELEKLKQSNEELKTQVQQANIQMASKVDGILEQVKAYAEKFPIHAQVVAEALKNIKIEKGDIASQREQLQSSGTSEGEIKTQDKILAAKEQKLQKNVENMGRTVFHDDKADLDKQLKALEEAGI